jgi:predicted ATPase
LDRIRDQSPERFDQLNDELARWLPEFDRILFETPGQGTRAIRLRTRVGGHGIPAGALSQGTLLALAILAVAYAIDPPSVACFEEPEHGIHPRLFDRVQEALYRLAYPEGFGASHPPVQVIATTHSPYFLNLFKDHPEEVVIANKTALDAQFERLSDRPDIDEILQGASLGSVWYTGILGGVPAER